MGHKVNPIAVRLGVNRSYDSSWFSDFYYQKLLYQDVNSRSYFGSIRPPKGPTFGFRLGRSIIIQFPKTTFVSFFVPKRQVPQRFQRRRSGGERGDATKQGKATTWLRPVGKVAPVKSLDSGEDEKKWRKESRGREAAKAFQSMGVSEMGKDKELRVWPKKKQVYGYHDHSPSMKSNLWKLHRASGSYGGVSDLGFLKMIEDDPSFRKRKSFKFFLPSKKENIPLIDHGLRKTISSVPPSLNYSVMQYFLHTKNQIHFNPAAVLNHFLAQSSVNAEGKGLDQRVRFASFIAASQTESNDRKRLAFAHFIRQANQQRFGIPKHVEMKGTNIALFPFFGATFFFLRDGLGVASKNDDIREEVLGQLRTKWILVTKYKANKRLIEQLIERGAYEELRKGIEMMMEIILRNRRIPTGYNSYLNEVRNIESSLSTRTKTKTSIDSVKIKSIYQSAALIAQDLSFQLRNSKRSFRAMFGQVVKDIPSDLRNGIDGIRVTLSGRIGGAEIAKTECGKYGKTTRHVFNQKVDYAAAEASTRYGKLGVKVWISYKKNKRN